MARYAISAEGAASMRALAKQLYTEVNSILESSAVLETKIVAAGECLGIYESEILGIVHIECKQREHPQSCAENPPKGR